MRHLTSTMIIGLLCMLSSCTSDGTDPQNPPSNPDAKLTDLEQSVLKYGYDQLLDLCSSPDSNVVISPLSIVSALYMASDGANGETYTQITDVLHLQSVTPEQGRLYRSFLDKVEDENTEAELSVSNEVFVDPSRLSLAETYQEQVRSYYDADVEELDFSRETAVTQINNWVAEATNDRIDKVLETISPDEIMFLINATYFKADWANAFPEHSVSDRPFTKSDGSTVSAPFMHHDAYLANVITESYKAVELYFKDSIYSMTFLIPSAGVTPTQFLSDYDSKSFATLVSTLDQEMETSRIFLQIPKLELKAKYSLKNSLQNLGMKSAFDSGSADFGRFGTSSGNIFLSRVLHDVYLKIDEKGAEGAATTSVGVAVTSAPPSLFFDSPFLFMIKHRSSNVPVFIGVIRDPS